MRPWTGCLLILGMLCSGCGSDRTEFPLRVGQKWTYSVLTGLYTRVEDVSVAREVSVAGVEGYELAGPLGISRIAWKDGVLVADALANSQFEPELPLLVAGEESARRSWTGTLSAMGSKVAAKAEMVQSTENRQIGGKSVRARKVVITLRGEKNTVELITWYVADVGPLMQEQRTNGRLDVSLEALSAP